MNYEKAILNSHKTMMENQQLEASELEEADENTFTRNKTEPTVWEMKKGEQKVWLEQQQSLKTDMGKG